MAALPILLQKSGTKKYDNIFKIGIAWRSQHRPMPATG
jgi:hypothetical protein